MHAGGTSTRRRNRTNTNALTIEPNSTRRTCFVYDEHWQATHGGTKSFAEHWQATHSGTKIFALLQFVFRLFSYHYHQPNLLDKLGTEYEYR